MSKGLGVEGSSKSRPDRRFRAIRRTVWGGAGLAIRPFVVPCGRFRHIHIYFARSLQVHGLSTYPGKFRQPTILLRAKNRIRGTHSATDGQLSRRSDPPIFKRRVYFSLTVKSNRTLRGKSVKLPDTFESEGSDGTTKNVSNTRFEYSLYWLDAVAKKTPSIRRNRVLTFSRSFTTAFDSELVQTYTMAMRLFTR